MVAARASEPDRKEGRMFSKKTVFIVGAGASAELDLPLGGGLAKRISAKMDIRFERGFQPVGTGDLNLFSQITYNRQQHVNEFQSAGWLIRDGILLSRSIDDFLDLHRDDPRVRLYGKAAIVQCILEAERTSKLYFDRNSGVAFSPAKLSDTWLVKFMQMLTPGIPKENVREIFDNVAFVVFNYDRCIEWFLLNALQTVYGIREQDAKSIIDDLEIMHPYGLIDPSVQFGTTQANWLQLADGIKTYTEQVGAGDVVSRIRAIIDRAAHIVFLGFAYHDQNMLLLKPLEELSASKSIFGTAFGMSDSDVDVTGHQIDSWFGGRDARGYRKGMIKIENRLKSAELFDHYAKSLTGG
jgi:hypothetical protein